MPLHQSGDALLPPRSIELATIARFTLAVGLGVVLAVVAMAWFRDPFDSIAGIGVLTGGSAMIGVIIGIIDVKPHGLAALATLVGLAGAILPQSQAPPCTFAIL